MEIMAPVGSFESLAAAIKAGADSVYFGVGNLNMRARSANNFNLSDLKKITNICKKENIRTYLTLNTIMYDNDLKLMKKVCNEAKKANITAIIASDLSVIQYARSINLRVHISTQANISNLEAVKFFSRYADSVILARELNLKQIKYICSQIKKQNIRGPSGELIKIEVFIHRALCVSISGKCYMSLALYNHSANKGDCFQVCRHKYKVTDEETGQELIVDNNQVMSPKDLSTITVLDKIIKAGVSILKIEGRARKSDYVYTTTKVYKEAVNSVLNKTYTKEKINHWQNELKSVYNRGFWEGGYYLGNNLGEWANQHGSDSTSRKVYVAKGIAYFSKPKIAHFKVESEEINIGDIITITGKTTAIFNHVLAEMKIDNKPISKAIKGDEITFPLSERIRKNDKLYVIKKV
jgi:U32 family peptidase